MIATRSDHKPALALLSARQHQILSMLSTGEWTRKEIAAFVGITEFTLKNHLQAIYKALDVDNLTAALRATGCIITSD